MLLAACLLLTLIDFSLSQAQYTGDPNETYSLMTVLASQPILTAFAAALANYTPLFNLVAEGNCTSKDCLILCKYMQGSKTRFLKYLRHQKMPQTRLQARHLQMNSKQ